MKWYLAALKNSFKLSGRARRKEYWMFNLFYFLSIILIVGIVVLIKEVAKNTLSTPVFEQLDNILRSILLILVFLQYIPGFSVTIRRLHDVGLSGWFVLINIIPYLGFLIMMFFMLKKGTDGPNRYGEDPRAADIPKALEG